MDRIPPCTNCITFAICKSLLYSDQMKLEQNVTSLAKVKHCPLLQEYLSKPNYNVVIATRKVFGLEVHKDKIKETNCEGCINNFKNSYCSWINLGGCPCESCIVKPICGCPCDLKFDYWKKFNQKILNLKNETN